MYCNSFYQIRCSIFLGYILFRQIKLIHKTSSFNQSKPTLINSTDLGTHALLLLVIEPHQGNVQIAGQAANSTRLQIAGVPTQKGRVLGQALLQPQPQASVQILDILGNEAAHLIERLEADCGRLLFRLFVLHGARELATKVLLHQARRFAAVLAGSGAGSGLVLVVGGAVEARQLLLEYSEQFGEALVGVLLLWAVLAHRGELREDGAD